MSDAEADPGATLPPENSKVDEEIKQKQVLIELNRRKRLSKRGATKARHDLEKLIVRSAISEIQALEHQTEHYGRYWKLLNASWMNS